MDSNLPDLKEDLSSLDKLTQSYLLLKKKIYGTDELIKQYNDKQKECERLKADLDTTTKEIKKVTYNYNSTLAKVIKLELQNTEYKKNTESLTQQANEFKIKAAADQQLIQQLKCKIKDLEKNDDNKIMQYDLEKSSLQVKVKELEQELRNVKKSYDTKIKKIEKKVPTENNKPKSKEIGINTVLTNHEIRLKPEVAERCVVTEETYNVKDDVYPVFCGKCEILLEPPPLEKICKIMTNSCPKLIEKISSPKKVSPPIRIAPEISNDYCKPENLTSMPSISPHLQNQNTHPNFIPPNVLHPHTPVSSNRPEYCSNYIPVPNLMNPGTYYIGPPPVNPVPLTNLNAINQNNHSEITTSLSIISSLQKKIDTLETKIEKLTKTKSKRLNSCSQQQQSNTCMCNMNSSMQFNFIELWKRMADLHDNKNKEKECFDTRDRNSKKLKIHKMARLKPNKRLQNARNSSWRVESVSKKVEQSCSRKRPKKRNSRFSSLFSKAEVSSANSEDVENSNSDSDTNSYTDVFGDTTNSKMDTNVKSKSSPCKEKSVMKPNASKATTSSAQSTDVDDTVETMRNSIESSKSLGGETDSGILSDSVESSKLMHLEADIDTCLNSTRYENTPRIKSSIGNTLRAIKKIKSGAKSKLPEKSLIKTALQRINKRTEADTGSKTPSQPNECSENIEDKKVTEVPQDDDVIAQDKACTSTATRSVRKRKINGPQEQKTCASRGNLLKKLRNLRKSSKRINNTRQNISDPQNMPNCKNEDHSFEEQKNLDQDTSIATIEDYVPKKRPRIAHVPKSTITDSISSPINSLQVRKCLAQSVGKRKIELQTIPASNDVPNAIADQTKKNDISSNQLSETNIELQEADDDRTQQMESTSVNIINSNSENCIESDVDKVTIPNIKNVPSESETKNSSNIDIDSYNHSNTSIESDVNDSVKEIMKTEIELNNRPEQLEQPLYNYNDSDTIVKSDINDSVKAIESGNLCESFKSLEQKTEDSIEEGECSTEETSIPPQTDLNVQESFMEESCSELDLYSTRNESNDSLKGLDVSIPKSDADTCNGDRIDIKDGHSINVQENSIKERNIQQVKKNTGPKKTKFNKRYNIEPASYPLKKLQQYINENKSPRTYHSQNKKLLPVRLLADKFINKQLQRLIDSDWETSVHWDVIEKLKSVCSSRIIAKGVVEFLFKQSDDQCLDKTYTPPAPLMTNTQQKIVALLVDLKESDPMIFQFVQAGIEYKLFRLNHSTTISRSTVESFARMYTILARIKKDREKVRIFCCDALYCLGLNAIIVLYTVFTCWPEVFPSNETSNKLLPKCMAHLITMQQAADYPKLKALKNLISIFYKYPIGTMSKDLLDELLTALQEKSHTEIETAVLLLAKREGTTWAYKNIIRSALLPMIINDKLPSAYRAFWLLGNLMRVFPIEDKDNSVGEIVEQLCDLINSGEGSSEQNEGVISALLSLSRHKFHEVVQNTLKWKPGAPLRDRTEEQFNGLFNQRNTDFWKCYLRTNKHLFVTHQESKT